MTCDKKENPQTRRTKLWLTEALIKLMKQKPYSKISIQELVQEADLSRAGFYNHYSRKREILYDKIASLHLEAIDDMLRENKKNQFENWIAYLQFFLREKEFFLLLYKNNLTHLIYKVIIDNYKPMLNLIYNTIEKAIEDDEDAAMAWMNAELERNGISLDE